MATVDDEHAADRHVRFCPQCGREAGNGRFCAECGSLLTVNSEPPARGDASTQRMPTAGSATTPPVVATRAGDRGRRTGLIVAAALGLVAIAVAVIILATSSSGPSADSTYRQKLTSVLSPVIVANTQLSQSLQSLSGTNTQPVKTAATQAQQAIVAARGALVVLSVPGGDQQLSQQVQQALTQEAGYVAAVDSTVADPTSGTSQLQTLATQAQSALVPLSSVAQGAGQSLSNNDQLVAWASGQVSAAARRNAAAQRRSVQQAAATAAHRAASQGGSGSSTSSPPSSSGPPAVAQGTSCGGTLHAGPNTTCAFALNVQQAWANAPGTTNTLQVYSPVTGQTYTMNCAPAGSGITCSGGNNASVSW